MIQTAMESYAIQSSFKVTSSALDTQVLFDISQDRGGYDWPRRLMLRCLILLSLFD